MQLRLHEKSREMELVSDEGVERLQRLLASPPQTGAASACAGALCQPRDLRARVYHDRAMPF